MAHLGWGTTLTYDKVSNIGEIISVSYAPTSGFNEYETTRSNYMTVIPSTIDSNEIAIRFYYDGDNETEAFMDELKAQEIGEITISVPNSRFKCDGYVQSVAVNSVVDEAVIMDVVFRLTGEFTFTGF